MKIKRIEAWGFKSFADGIALDLHEGITAIVGPNGCGKSNIVDALRWAMGERSAKYLRGHEMFDVIFQGSDSRKPQDTAEVALTFVNDGKGWVQGALKDYSEVEIRRRLSRDGTSEYFINRVQCRARDIQDFFMDAGVGGLRGFSIIQQGQVDRLVTAKPEERRLFLEEVAGIVKYRSRRELALSRMERTEQNLARVGDVVKELSRHVSYLERQVGKARKYRELSERLNLLDRERLRRLHQRISGALEEASARVAGLETQLTERQRAATEDQSLRETVRLELQRLEKAMNDAREMMRRADVDRESTLGKVRLVEGGISHLESDEVKAATEIEGLQQKIAVMAVETETTIRAISETSASLETARARLAEQSGRARELAHVRGEHAARREAVQKAAFQTEKELEKGEQAAKTASERIDELIRRRSGVESDLSAREAQLAELKQMAFGFENELKDAERSRDALKQRIGEAEAGVAGAVRREEAAAGHVDQIRRQHSAEAAKLESLRALEARYEGYDEGVKAIMLHAEHRLAHEGKNGIYGLVADVIEPEADVEMAVESVLGSRLQSVVVKSQEVGIEAVDYLKQMSVGRSSFVPLSGRAYFADAVQGGDAPGLIGPLRDRVQVKEGFDPVVDVLLGDVLLVDSLDNALHIWSRTGQRQMLVTMAGDVVDPKGVITGGKLPQESGILRKKRDLREIDQTVRQLASDLASAELELSRIKEDRIAAETALDELRAGFHREDIRVVRGGSDLKQARDREAGLSDGIASLRAQLDRVQEDLARISGERMALDGKITELKADRERLAAELAGHEEAFLAADVAAREAESGLAGLREDIVGLEAALRRHEENRARLEHEQSVSASQAEAIRRASEQRAAEIASRRRELEELQELLQGIETEKQKTASNVEATVAAYEQGRAQVAELETRLHRTQDSLSEVQGELAGWRARQNEQNLQLDYLVREVRERYETDLPLPEATEDELRASAEYESYETLDEEVQKIRRDRDRLGPVNIEALDEQSDVNQRLEKLMEEEGDLKKALEDLRDSIQKINRTTRDRFKETFDFVNQRFGEVFVRLFRGGRAELHLSDPDNLLESGIEIMAQPPGKKLQDVNLLSGGEKALTAIAFVLAMFLTRPSPFCLLDEVDAPLDDANIGRFNDVVRELTRLAQVVVITHNRQTMEVADTLSGVTMEEPGVSKLVSVKLH
ncbi:MAG: chromosome segregation protein SMC [Deltaproteobacteria bacterium]|nr:chromosome segregation protein SMC [Deltaproteobacteria bacterium]